MVVSLLHRPPGAGRTYVVLCVVGILLGDLTASGDSPECPFTMTDSNCTYVSSMCLCVLKMYSVDYEDAAMYCAKEVFGCPTSIHSDKENDALVDLIQEPSNGVWIGLRGGGSDLTWYDGTPVDYNNTANTSLVSDCFAMVPGSNLWYARSCSDQLQPACITYAVMTTPPTTAEVSTPESSTPHPAQGGPNVILIVVITVVIVLVSAILASFVVFIIVRRGRSRPQDELHRNLQSDMYDQ